MHRDEEKNPQIISCSLYTALIKRANDFFQLTEKEQMWILRHQ